MADLDSNIEHGVVSQGDGLENDPGNDNPENNYDVKAPVKSYWEVFKDGVNVTLSVAGVGAIVGSGIEYFTNVPNAAICTGIGAGVGLLASVALPTVNYLFFNNASASDNDLDSEVEVENKNQEENKEVQPVEVKEEKKEEDKQVEENEEEENKEVKEEVK